MDCGAGLADAPDWLFDRLDANRGKGKPLEHRHDVLNGAIANGVRNATLAGICGKLLFHDVNLLLVRDVLLAVNAARCDPPLDTTEIENIVASVAKSHLRKQADGGRTKPADRRAGSLAGAAAEGAK